jgi:hypothetical protein
MENETGWTGVKPVFLDFCAEALGRIENDPSEAATQVRNELLRLREKLRAWAHSPNAPDRQATIAQVLEAYRNAMQLRSRTSRPPPPGPKAR